MRIIALYIVHHQSNNSQHKLDGIAIEIVGVHVWNSWD